MSTTQPLIAPVQYPTSDHANPYPGRLMCLDVFRGLAVVGMIVVDNLGSDDKAYWAIKHAEWNGWSPADFISASFLFLFGVSMVFSLPASMASIST